MHKHKLGVVIGRFQPVHLNHLTHLIIPALKQSDELLILLGSSKRARDIKNPFLWTERRDMIVRALQELEPELDISKLRFEPIKDYPYSDIRWQIKVQGAVQAHVYHQNTEITLFGVDKDASTYYLRMFPYWNTQMLDSISIMNATTIRTAWFEDKFHTVATGLEASTVSYLNAFLACGEGRRLLEEYKHIQDYKSGWDNAPYPPIHHTIDVVIIWRGMVLLVKRNAQPGKGLLALPGGFLRDNEWVIQGGLRELNEETRIRFWVKDSTKRLRLSKHWVNKSHMFDNPDRSLRGRTITNAYLCLIPDEFEIDLQAGDDASTARFYPLFQVLENMGYDLFEDHQAIIANMVLSI